MGTRIKLITLFFFILSHIFGHVLLGMVDPVWTIDCGLRIWLHSHIESCSC